MSQKITALLKNKKVLIAGGVGLLAVGAAVVVGVVVMKKSGSSGTCNQQMGAKTPYLRFKMSNGKYLSANAAGALSLADTNTANEHWIVEPSTRLFNRVQIRNVGTKLYLEANLNQSADAVSPKPDTWESYDIKCLGSGKIALMGFHGRWLGLSADGTTVGNTDAAMGPSAASIITVV